ncbi:MULTISPECIES: LysR substrate-binding domain-containing protein [unclassified Streptomyces]|uniref:LysR family transcriptional regulator n=1 Tax=unclassified Streptomyces TaxID=2593676 RepID=UPI002E364570|nr:LysR substrate-binding domain-containing protein [Streptomyces sp. NBC_01268]
MLDVRRLRLLRELALRGTIAAVAEALSFTPSAVSQQLATLEREAGVPLLERTGRRVRLTPAGEKLVRHAEAVLERLELASAELAEARSGPAGPLRIGAFPTATRTIVPGALVLLAARHPALEPMVSEVDPAAVAHALRAGDLDVALVHGYDLVPAALEPGLAEEPLCEEAMFLATHAPSHGPAEGPDAGLAVLAPWHDAPWIVSAPDTLCRAVTERVCRAAGFAPRVRHQVDEFATVLAFVAAGQGVAVVPQLGALAPPPGVRLTPLPVRRRTRIAFRGGAGPHPAVAALTRALRDSVPAVLDGSPATPAPAQFR